MIDYLREEDRVLHEHLGQWRLRLEDDQRCRLAVAGKALGWSALKDVAWLTATATRLRPVIPNLRASAEVDRTLDESFHLGSVTLACHFECVPAAWRNVRTASATGKVTFQVILSSLCSIGRVLGPYGIVHGTIGAVNVRATYRTRQRFVPWIHESAVCAANPLVVSLRKKGWRDEV